MHLVVDFSRACVVKYGYPREREEIDMPLTSAAQWLNTVFAGFDQSVTAAVHKLYEAAGGFLTPLMELISFFGKEGICLILLALALIFFRKTRRFGTAMLLGLAIGALFTNLFLKIVVARPRPYADENGFFYPLWQMLGSHTESDKSFPSGHTTAAFAAMVPVFWLGKKRVSWLALVFAFLMGLSRIYLVVHYPSDVLGGLLVGVVAGALGVLISRVLPEKWYELEFYRRKRGGHEACSD